MITFPIQRIKQKIIWKNVYKSVSKWKLTIKKRKERNNFIKPIVHINNMILNNCWLSRCNLSNDSQWGSLLFEDLVFKSNLIIWFDNKECALSWDLLLSFWRWRWIGIRLAIVSIPDMENVQKAPEIYKTTLLCIFLSSLKEYANNTLL